MASQTVIITGAAGNLGQATVDLFLAKEWNVIATVSPRKSLGYTSNGELDIHEVDLSNESGVESFIDTVKKKNNQINTAVLLVGGFAMGKFADTDVSALRKMITLNFETAYNIVRHLLPVMESQSTGGRIVLIGSRPAIKPSDGKNAIAYSLSKSLVFRLAEIINATSAKKKVVAHVIVPSTLDTPQNREAMPDADFNDWVKPSKVAEAIYFLCSAQGQSLREGIIKVYGNS